MTQNTTNINKPPPVLSSTAVLLLLLLLLLHPKLGPTMHTVSIPCIIFSGLFIFTFHSQLLTHTPFSSATHTFLPAHIISSDTNEQTSPLAQNTPSSPRNPHYFFLLLPSLQTTFWFSCLQRVTDGAILRAMKTRGSLRYGIPILS